MALDERKEKALECIMKGETITNVASLAGVTRKSIYAWLDDAEFKAELDRRVQSLKTHGEQRMTAKLDSYINEIERIALTGRSEKVKADCLQYLINRVCGSPASKQADTADSNNKDKDVQSADDLRDELARFRNENKAAEN